MVFNTANVAISLDREGEEPIYRQLIQHIRMQIQSGSLPAGTRLPASRDLARQLQISRISVVNAYAELRAEGFLSAHAGRGTFVARDGTSSETHKTRSDDSNGHDTPPDRCIRDMIRMTRKQPGIISFSYGAPPTEFFPVQAVKEAVDTVLERDGANALTYEKPEGFTPLRVAVRDYVSALGIQCSLDNVLITGGAQQALDLVIQSILSEGETLVTSNPTYLGIIDITRVRRINLHGIPIDQDGIRVDMLENYVLDQRPQLIYVTPSFQNPTGVVMPLHRRRQLINLANEHQIPILEDGVYHEFRFEGEAVPPLKALDETGIVIHASAFTKMLLPGMRIGYVISDGQHSERLVRVKEAADISTPGLNQRVIHLLLERGVLAQHLERNNRELRRRRDAALDAADRYLPPGTSWNVPCGGLYLWVHLPKTGPTAAELYVAAAQMGVTYAIGSIFYTNSCGSYQMRINYGTHPPAIIERGMRRLGDAWRELASDYVETERLPML